MPGNFFDTNIIVYFASGNGAKADRAEALLIKGGVISVQVLNEVTNVARRKMALPWPQVHRILATLRTLLIIQPLTIETHENGIRLAERYGLSIYDGQIVAAAMLAGCEVLWSEDMHDGLVIDGRLRIRNPFA